MGPKSNANRYVVPADFSAGMPVRALAAFDPSITALERTYYDWWADNHHALDMGLPGDISDLRERLNAAFAKYDKTENGAIKITPAMIKAGLDFMIDEAFNTLTSRVENPEFIEAFIKAIFKVSCPQIVDDAS